MSDEVETLRQTTESQARTIEKLRAEIKEMSKGLYTCSECSRSTAQPLTIGPGIVVCSKRCRLKAARKLRR